MMEVSKERVILVSSRLCWESLMHRGRDLSWAEKGQVKIHFGQVDFCPTCPLKPSSHYTILPLADWFWIVMCELQTLAGYLACLQSSRVGRGREKSPSQWEQTVGGPWQMWKWPGAALESKRCENENCGDGDEEGFARVMDPGNGHHLETR